MRGRVVVAGALVAVIVVAGAVVIGTRLAGQGRSVQEPVSGSRGGSVALRGARVSVRPGAVAGHGTLMASTGRAAPAAGPGTGLRLAGTAEPVHFQVTGARVSGTLEVTFRVGAIGLPRGNARVRERRRGVAGLLRPGGWLLAARGQPV